MPLGYLLTVTLLALGISQPAPAGHGSATAQTVAVAPDTALRWQRHARFRPISQALKQIRRHVDVAVVAPKNLPAGAKAVGRPIISGSHAQLAIAVPGGRFRLSIQYGNARFDGCPSDPRKVAVGDQPAVINTTDGKQSYTTLVWPATLKRLEGRYGLSGRFTEARILALANSMEDARASRPHGGKRNC